MLSAFWVLLFIVGGLTLAYKRVSLSGSTAAAGAALVAYSLIGDPPGLWAVILWATFGLMVALNFRDFRRNRITRPLLATYRRMLPSMSSTEREALEAGSVWWEGDVFSGAPDWRKLSAAAAPRLTEEERAFLDGPDEELCQMIDEWEVSHELGDLPPKAWQFMKDKGFFAMIIPKAYGGLEFSAYAHSQVLIKVSGHSGTAGSIVAVPNSLGPAELLLHYGTEEQKDHYLPGLAKGTEIPCFALTHPRAGSDAASIPDQGYVCKGEFNGEEIVGIRLTWDKRYITLAPVATVLGLAFRLYDPEGLLGDPDKTDYGITAALIPTDTPGVEIGRRHLPLTIPFQNGPTSGKDVFVPLDCIIGGPKMAGQGWRMLVECLSVGRCISLPSNAVGGAKAGLFSTGAYARIRKQFGMPIGHFEGIQEVMARMAGNTYIGDAARSVTVAAVDAGEKPAVPSAILKYHCTEIARSVANDAMDIHAGKGVMLGPNNYLGIGWGAVPVMITVEGANILTRSLIIFGQGAVRCHPFVLRELHAARDEDRQRGLVDFDDALFGHFGYAISNAARSLVSATTLARYMSVPEGAGSTRRFYQHIARFSASFALAADVAMLTLGGALKKKEMLSSRLGDILSTLYLASTVLKHYENQGRPAADLPVVEWACRSLLYKAQEQLHGFLRNFPNRPVAAVLRALIFPRGRTYYAPADGLSRRVVELMITPSETRERVCGGIYRSIERGSPLGELDEVMRLAIEITPLEKKIRRGLKEGKISAPDVHSQIDQAVAAAVLTEEEGQRLRDADVRIMKIIDVDDFTSEELARRPAPGTAGPRPATASKPTRAKAAKPPAEKDVAVGG